MKKVFKWFLIIGGSLLILLIAAVLIIPQVYDIKQHKPLIEETVSKATGRTFVLGDEMDLSLFPWVGVELTDIRLGNPEGFTTEDMVTAKRFEVRLKVMPLLSSRIEVKTFIVDSPVIYLEKQKDGKANWEGIGSGKPSAPKEKKAEPEPAPAGALPIASLQVDSFSIVNGRFVYSDHMSGLKKDISDFNLKLADISLEEPVSILLNAKVDGKPFSVDGTAGPIGKEPGKGTVSLDFAVNVFNELKLNLNGNLIDPLTAQQYDMQIDVAPFSPRKLMKALDLELPVQTSDPEVLNNVSFAVRVKGTPKDVSLTNGSIGLDDSKLDFSGFAKQFSKPDLMFDIALDKIDLDRYLPKQSKTADKKAKSPSSKKSGKKKKTDYTPIRKLVMDGKLKTGRIKAHGAVVENINVQIKAKNGVITVEPFNMDLYKGTVRAKLGVDVRKNTPKTSVSLKADKIQVGPLLNDAVQKDIIEGTLKADLNLGMQGETPDMIKRTLNGNGELFFNDGAIIGIDIAGMVRNVQASFGAPKAGGEKPKTDFAELVFPFTARNGLVNVGGGRLVSPLLRIVARGNVDLNKELLDMRVEPKVVATLKGQGDTKQRSGLMVPLIVSGSFTSPKIRPDLEGMIKNKGIGNLDKESLKSAILGGEDNNKDGKKGILDNPKDNVEKQIKELIPGFFLR